VREALAGEPAWLVGGAVRDRLLGAPVLDLDVAVDGDVRAAARRLARAADGPLFELSDAFGAWRVIGPDRAWHADLVPLRGATIEEDLALRDVTVNAMAEPLAGGERVDPFGGAGDLADRRLRAVGPAQLRRRPAARPARRPAGLRSLASGPRPDGTARGPEAPRCATSAPGARLRRAQARRDRPATPSQGSSSPTASAALAAVLPSWAPCGDRADRLPTPRRPRPHARGSSGRSTSSATRRRSRPTRPRARVRASREPLGDDLTRGALRFAACCTTSPSTTTAVADPKGGFGFPHASRCAVLVREILARLRQRGLRRTSPT
jgi:hypothetical protein